MAPSEEPLLTDNSRPPSEASDEAHAEEEEDALLTGSRKPQLAPKRSWAFWREVGAFVWAVVATAVVIVLAVAYQHEQTTSRSDHSPWKGGGRKPTGKRNLIFMVSDGMGPTSMSLTRSFRQFESGLPANDVLVLDRHLIGSSRTRSTSSLVTDSAAGATAFSCGKKSYNGAISVLPDASACGTVLEAAKRAGYMTGLVVTTRITDATPACFAAHVNVREEEDVIARQMVGEAHPLGRVVDLLLGGGRCHFQPNTTAGSCRADDVDVVQRATDEHGFTYISDRKAFDSLASSGAVKLPLLGLFAHTDIPYEVDRRQQNDVYPSLDEMANLALKALSAATQDSEQGFFLMIEGSRIDHAGHANDPVAQVHEVLAYDKAFASALDFVDRSPVPGVVVSTSDHETGGLATARQLHTAYPEYLWYPDRIANASHSGEALAHAILQFKREEAPPADELRDFVKKAILVAGLGVTDASDAEIDAVVSHEGAWPPLHYVLTDIVSRRVQSGWSTHGHSAVDVNVYASAPGDAPPLIGNHENTEVGTFLADYLDVNVDAVTKELREKGKDGWTGDPVPTSGSHGGLEHYRGDFRKRCEACGDVGVEHALR